MLQGTCNLFYQLQQQHTLQLSLFLASCGRRVLHATCNSDVIDGGSQSEPARVSRRKRSTGYTAMSWTFSQINCRIITYLLTRPPPRPACQPRNWFFFVLSFFFSFLGFLMARSLRLPPPHKPPSSTPRPRPGNPETRGQNSGGHYAEWERYLDAICISFHL